MKHLLILFVSLFLLSCSETERDFKNFDFEKWKSDRNGCKGTRMTQKEAINQLTETIKGMSQNEFLRTFGRPDAQMLNERNIKSYVYYLESGTQCNTEKITTPTQAASVAIRFNAVSLAIEVSFQKGNP